ncbi:MAG: 30S ribosomal protein S14 [Candidatus Altiarchaeota archaeon]
MSKKTKDQEERQKFDTRNLICSVCGARHGVIHKYGLEICRRCFREVAPSIGFNKFS